MHDEVRCGPERVSSVLMASILSVLLPGCGGMAMSESAGGYDPEPEPTVEDEPVIEESDLYKLEGDWLYVQNPTSGLNIIDVSNPDEPLLHRQLSSVRGSAGELYVRDDRVYVLFKGSTDSCPVPSELWGAWPSDRLTSRVTIVTSAPSDPKVAGTTCLPGDLVTSRVVGGILYVITRYEASTGYTRTGLLSLDVADPANLRVADVWVLTGATQEVHVTEEAIFLAQGDGSQTRVTYVDIADPDGVMVERDSITVSGQPQGRFHMDAYGDAFRIVTFSGVTSGANLHVIDTSDPDHLLLLGSLGRIGVNEELWATRFVGDMAYVVTYERWEPTPSGGRWVWGWDPLWVISLDDPARPRILAELQIPGWSTFLYPRGDTIFAVGRGDRGRRVAAALFDVSDPARPLRLDRVDFGADDSASEANMDFRGVSIVDGELGPVPLVTVPYTVNVWDGEACTPVHQLQLISLEEDDLSLRGAWKPGTSEQGLIRRTFAHGDNLYVVSDRGTAALDVSDRLHPWARVSIDLAGEAFVDECPELDFEIDPPRMDDVFSIFPFGCSVDPVPGRFPPVLVLAVLVVLLLSRRRR